MRKEVEEEKSVSQTTFTENDKDDLESDNESKTNEEEEEDEGIAEEDLIVSLFLFTLQFRPESNLRKWLKSHGKTHCIDFDDVELKQLREYFNALDEDGSGSIGVEELEDPLIALGLVENRQQVQQIVQLVDEDGSEMIEFGEFLSIIKGGSNSVRIHQDDLYQKDVKESSNSGGGTGAIYSFFKKLTSG